MRGGAALCARRSERPVSGSHPRCRDGAAGLGCVERAGRDGAAHSTGTGWRWIGGIMRKRPGVQHRLNSPMCRAGPSAHGSPSTGNRRSRKNRGIAGKTRNRSTGVRLSNVQHPCDRPQKNPAAPIIGLGGDVAAGGMGAEPAPLFAETCASHSSGPF